MFKNLAVRLSHAEDAARLEQAVQRGWEPAGSVPGPHGFYVHERGRGSVNANHWFHGGKFKAQSTVISRNRCLNNFE